MTSTTSTSVPAHDTPEIERSRFLAYFDAALIRSNDRPNVITEFDTRKLTHTWIGYVLGPYTHGLG